MSSSRSIAAARNRRSGEQAPPTRQGQTSQPTFSKQPQQSQKINVTAQNSTPSVPVNSAKLTISDAIGLITLRLGRVEQFMQTLEYEGKLNTNSNNASDNTQLVDKSIINSIVNRLDSLEKKEKDSVNNNKLEIEIRNIKDLLMAQILKYEKFNIEIDKKFSDVDSAFIEIEKQTDSLNSLLNEQIQISIIDQPQTQLQTQSTIIDQMLINSDQNVESVTQSPASPEPNLKNIIEQELSNSVNLS